MGLLPLEFTDCLLDSPYFRENLKAHERQLDQTSADIKSLIHDIQGVLDAAKILTKSKKALAVTLENFRFDCLGTSLTDDEIIIASSLKQFGKFLSSMESEMSTMLEQADQKFITPLVNFRKDQIGSVKQTRKAFDKATTKLCTAQDKYANMSSKKEESLAESAEIVRHELKNLNSCSMEYVYLMHMVQERKKFEFMEAILEFTESWVRYFKHGNEVASNYSSYMSDLESRVQKTRNNFSATAEQYESLKQKMLSAPQDPGTFNKMYTRQGYLYVQSKKNLKLGSVWSKYYCQYQTKTRTLTMIPYSQLAGKITNTESIRVASCVCKDDIPEKFRFVVTGEDLTETSAGVVSHTVQSLSEYERKNWVQALGGTWPAVSTLQRIKADSVEENLNSVAFTFLKDCLSELECRGLTDQGLYRVGGVVSKVKKLLNQGLDPQPGDSPIDLTDPKQWESKTIASAVKQYFRDLNKPLMTYQLYHNFIEAAKHESEGSRLNEIYLVLQKLPVANREILKVLIRHLSRVAARADKNLMTAGNLGVCFGPTLLRPREETVASIMDIKFCNEVLEILIDNCDKLFPTADSSPEFLHPSQRRPSIDSRSTSGGAVSTVSLTPSATTTPKCKRTQSFSSFSQLSTNSLPDIKEFHSDRSERPRSKSHQHESPLKVSVSLSKEGSPAPLHLSKAATQDDLMASLEMMNSLAADLPMSPLRRSYTLQHRKMRQTPAKEVTRKPPLPKLTTVALSPTSPTAVSSNTNIPELFPSPSVSTAPAAPSRPSPLPFLRHNSAPSPGLSLPGEADAPGRLFPPGVAQTLPKPNRPTDLPVRLAAVVADPRGLSPGQSGLTSSESLLIEEEVEAELAAPAKEPPPVPQRKYKKIFVSQASIDQHQPMATHYEYTGAEGQEYKNCVSLEVGQDREDLANSSPCGVGSDSEQQDFQYTVTVSSPILPGSLRRSDAKDSSYLRTNVSVDSGVMASPSPPTDSGIALSPKSRSRLLPAGKESSVVSPSRLVDRAGSHSEDALSVLSTSLSEASDTSGSRYDNVHFYMNNNNHFGSGGQGEDNKPLVGDDADSDTSSLMENLIVETSESDAGQYECSEPDIAAAVDNESAKGGRGPKCLDNTRENRDSGPYENVAGGPVQTSDGARVKPNLLEYTAGPGSDGGMPGINSIRRILTTGQTTNV